MTSREMADEILVYIRENGDASFANIMNLFGEEARGEWAKEVLPNVVLWAGMSRSLVDAINIIQPLTELKSCHPWAYLADGHLLRMPLAKRPTRKGYAKPHWLRVLLVVKEGK
jgi:hypothetical protein